MTKTEPTQGQMCADLARARGYKVMLSANGFYWLKLGDDLISRRGWRDESTAWDDAPNPFTDLAASRALVEWLATDDLSWDKFLLALLERTTPISTSHTEAFMVELTRRVMTASLPTIARAAWEAVCSDHSEKAQG